MAFQKTPTSKNEYFAGELENTQGVLTKDAAYLKNVGDREARTSPLWTRHTGARPAEEGAR